MLVIFKTFIHHHLHPYSHPRWLQCQGPRTVCQPCPEGLVWNCESKTCAAQGNCPDIPKVCWYVCGRIPPVKKVTTLTTMETIVVTTLLTTTKITNTTAPVAVNPYTSTPFKPSTSTENTWVDHGSAGTSTSTTSGSYNIHPSYLSSNEICDTNNDLQCKSPGNGAGVRSTPPHNPAVARSPTTTRQGNQHSGIDSTITPLHRCICKEALRNGNKESGKFRGCAVVCVINST